MRIFASRIRRTLASIVAMSVAPVSSASGRWALAGSVLAISRSTPALTARAPASVGSAANPWVTRLRTPLASLTTNPSKPSVPRSRSVTSQPLPAAGTPLRSM